MSERPSRSEIFSLEKNFASLSSPLSGGGLNVPRDAPAPVGETNELDLEGGFFEESAGACGEGLAEDARGGRAGTMEGNDTPNSERP